MDPKETAVRYDQIAERWQAELRDSTYGLTALERAIGFTTARQIALDVGCGSSGRFLTQLQLVQLSVNPLTEISRVTVE